MWFRMQTQTAQSVLLENVNNFQIAKSNPGNYQVTQLIPGALPFTLNVASSLTENYWDMFLYRLDKLQSSVYAISLNYFNSPSVDLPLPATDWSLHPPSSQFLISDTSASICVREVSFRAYPVSFPYYEEYFTQLLSSQTKGTLFYLSPLTYQGNALSTDHSAQEISFGSTSALLCAQESKVLRVKVSSSFPDFPLDSATYS